RVLFRSQVVSLAGDVSGDLNLARQLDARDLAKRRVRLLRRGGVHAGAHAAALRAALESRGLDLGDLVAAPLADQLLDGWHLPAFSVACRLLSLCTAVMSRSLTPRPGVSHAPAAKIFSRLRGHANWPGAQACLRFSRYKRLI